MPGDMHILILIGCVLSLLTAAVAAIAFGQRPVETVLIYGASAVISAIGCATATFALLENQSEVLQLPLGLPWVGTSFRLDALSSLFLGIVNLGAMSASIYAMGYGREEHTPQRVLPFFAAFIAGMNLVVLSDDAFTFLLSWEFMSLASWALVMAHHCQPDNARAGYVYLLMASFGTFALLLAYGVLAGAAGNYGFEAMRMQHPTAFTSAVVLVLALIGAGSKAGLVPLHVWLPLAHPAAPSHVSALMSGVMTKVAIYAFIRIVFDLLGPPLWWWGIVVMALGGMTSLMGVLYALFENDIKRVLAYSTIENVGFIFVGLGLALAFRADHFEAAAVLALTAALFHVFNHSIFKSLLFFGSGAVLSATGERNMDKLGGLIHRMPLTAFACLAGCIAIAALPPSNGFASEWLTFQAVLLSPELPQWGLKLLVPAVGALLALSVALAAACFVRVFGITFLGQARTPAAADAHETDGYSLFVMFSLATICSVAGIVPGFFIDAIGPVAQRLFAGHIPQQSAVAWLSIVPITGDRSSYNGLLIFLFLAGSASLSACVLRLFGSNRVRRAPLWDGGFPNPTPLMQYSAEGFAQPLRRIFGTLLFRARKHIDMPPPGDMRPARIEVKLVDVIWDLIYAPLAGAVSLITERLNVLQFLTIRRYLSLVFGALVALLLVVAIWR